MMNLEFLYEMGKLTNNQNMQNACISHADLTLKNHFRTDNSCVHVVNYDSITGKIVEKVTHQGFNNNSSWARGQAWALYGYTMMYRKTGKRIYLEQAQKVAAFILNHPRMPKDLIPYWDLDAPNIPNEPRDASAAAIFASALVELSTFTNEKNNYFNSAQTILKNLSSDNYLAKTGENGLFILKHSTGNWPAKDEIDTPLAYADYYYLEALTRTKMLIENGKTELNTK
jgi:rhamnogalacturonyl hydrolase YesR